MKKECILILTSWYPCSHDVLNGNFVRDQTLILQKHAKIPIVVVLASDGKRDWIKDENLEYINIDHSNLIPARLGKLFLKLKQSYIIWQSKKKIKSFLKRTNYSPKLAIVQSVLGNVFIHQPILKNLRIPYFIIEHYVTFHKVEGYMYKPYSNISKVREFVQNATKRFGVSKTYSEIFSNYFRAEFEPLYNPISSVFFEKENNSVKKDFFTLINIGGGADTRKRPYFVVEAIHQAYNKDVELIFVAKEPIEEKIREYAAKLGCKIKISFFPRLTSEELIDLMDSSHVLLSASEYESFGLTIIEANARGLPVVCSKSGGPNDLVTTETGLLFDVDDLNGFVSALIKIRENYDSYDAQKIKNYAFQNFSEAQYAQNLISEINKL